MKYKRKLTKLGTQGLVEYAIDRHRVMWYRFLSDPDTPNFWKVVAY